MQYFGVVLCDFSQRTNLNLIVKQCTKNDSSKREFAFTIRLIL